jgi:hypothetical protein
MLVVDEDQFVARLGIAKADAAGARPIGDPPDGTMLGKFGVRELEKDDRTDGPRGRGCESS